MTFDEAQGYVVLATLAAPLLTMLLLVFVPGSQKMAVRYISAVAGAIMLGLSVYIFTAYQVGDGHTDVVMLALEAEGAGHAAAAAIEHFDF